MRTRVDVLIRELATEKKKALSRFLLKPVPGMRMGR
jgi:hypothetical protein